MFFLESGNRGCALVVSELKAVLLKCLLECGHDDWCQFSRRCYRDVVNACPVFQFCREPEPLLPHLVFDFRQSRA